MQIYDYLFIGFYFAFMIGLGLWFRKYNNDISDYFRAGGTTLWWMCGASSVMGGLSAWSFTGAASKIYELGVIILAVYITGWIGGIICFFFTCYRFRQMRVITSIDAVRRRYGSGTEQFYLWLQVPIAILTGGVALNTVAVFISSVFGTNPLVTLMVVGVIIIIVASCGGAWAVISGDFIQLLLLLFITSIVCFLALRLPEVGGLSGLLTKLPPHHLDWTWATRPSVVGFWIIALIVQTLLIANDLSAGAARFMSVKNGEHARKAALMGLGLSMLIPLVVVIPPLAAVVLFPHIGTQFPNLKNPGEAAYVAVSMKVLPHGMLGLMVSGIFAVAMANLDTGLNRNAGVFVNNFYRHILRPRASQRELLVAAKVFTVIFGLLIIGVGMLVALYRVSNLFDLVLTLGSLVALPLILPLAYGLFIKRAPTWAGWSTALVDFTVAVMAKWIIGAQLIAWVTGIAVARLNAQEIEDTTFATTVCLMTLIGSVWYLFTMRFTRTDSAESRQEIEAFFHDMNRPIDPVAEHIVYDDARQYRTVGMLCLIYGVVMLAGMLILNPLQGRMCFLFIGGMMSLLGGVLTWNGRKHPVPPAIPEGLLPQLVTEKAD